jgi:hypothetical protein
MPCFHQVHYLVHGWLGRKIIMSWPTSRLRPLGQISWCMRVPHPSPPTMQHRFFGLRPSTRAQSLRDPIRLPTVPHRRDGNKTKMHVFRPIERSERAVWDVEAELNRRKNEIDAGKRCGLAGLANLKADGVALCAHRRMGSHYPAITRFLRGRHRSESGEPGQSGPSEQHSLTFCRQRES